MGGTPAIGRSAQELVLAIAPERGATALALFQGEVLRAAHRVLHPELTSDHLQRRLAEQLPRRSRAAREFLDRSGVARGELAAVVACGALVRSLEPGTYLVDAALLRAEQAAPGDEAAKLGPPLARAVADDHGCPAYLVDATAGDERDEVARAAGAPYSGLCHALQLRSVARRHARAADRPLEELRLVAARLGTDTSVCVLREGRLADVAQLAFAEPGTAEARADDGDVGAMLALDAMAYRTAQAIGALACALAGEVDAVLLTGGAARATGLVNGICRRVEWIAPVFVYPGDEELAALADGARRVLRGDERPKPYR